jgi:hypothetical protein
MGHQASEAARDAVGGAGAQIAETAASVRERASDALRDAGVNLLIPSGSAPARPCSALVILKINGEGY